MVIDSAVDIVVVIGGGSLDERALSAAPADAFVIAADSGLDVALDAGLTPSVLVGDLDSISPSGLAWAAAHGIPVERHPADKAATDTELALRRATAMPGAARLLLLSAMGDRLDHAIGAIAALGAPGLATFGAISAWFGAVEMRVLHAGARTRLTGDPGSVFSLVAMHGICHGVEVRNARWPLHGATLEPVSTLGISNEIAVGPVEIGVASGVVTVIVPPPRSTPPCAP